MRNLLYLVGLMVILLQQVSCDGFTKVIEEDYSHYKAKGVIFSLLTNTDERDSAFRSGSYYSTYLTNVHKNRIYTTNSVPPSFARDRFYKAHVELDSDDKDISLIYVEQDNQHNIRNPFFAVQDNVTPGKVYTISAEYDPDVVLPEAYEWSPVSAVDTMPQIVSFALENAVLKYSDDDLSPEGGYVDVVLDDDPDRYNVYQVDVSAVLKYNDGRGSSSKLMYSRIESPGNEVDLDIFGNSRYDIFEDTDLTKDGRKRIYFNFSNRFGPYEVDGPATLLIRVTNLSDNYIRFRRSSDQYIVNDGNPFAEPVEIYTNVENGYGIFALAARSYGEIEVK